MDTFFVFLLLFTEICLLGRAYVVFDGDFISPSFVTLTLFIVSTVCLIYNINEWTIVFTFKAYALFTLSFILMITTEKWISRHKIVCTIGNRRKSKNFYGSRKDEVLYIPQPFDLILFLIFVFCAILYIYRVYMSGRALGATSFLMSIGYNKEEADFDSVSRLLYNITRIASYVYVIIFCHNIFCCKQKISQNLSSIIIVCLTMLITFFSGQRSAIICYLIGIIVAATISMYDAKKVSEKINIKRFMRRVAMIVVIVIAVFYLSANIVKGRVVERNFMLYITYYFGSTTALMGRIIEEPSLCHYDFSGYFGEKTFMGFWNTMYSYGIVSRAPAERKWINMGSSIQRFAAGNEFTFLCGPYIDFGFIGALIFVIVFYAFFSYIYYWKIKSVNTSTNRYVVCAIYIFLYAMIAMTFYQDTIRSYSRPINLLYICCLIVFSKIFLRIKKQEEQ